MAAFDRFFETEGEMVYMLLSEASSMTIAIVSADYGSASIVQQRDSDNRIRSTSRNRLTP
jgi:hypothetical protein